MAVHDNSRRIRILVVGVAKEVIMVATPLPMASKIRPIRPALPMVPKRSPLLSLASPPLGPMLWTRVVIVPLPTATLKPVPVEEVRAAGGSAEQVALAVLDHAGDRILPVGSVEVGNGSDGMIAGRGRLEHQPLPCSPPP